MEPQGLRIYIHSLDQVRISTTPEEVWRAAKPDSIVEIAIPHYVEPAMRQAILDKIGDNPLVYVRDGLPAEFAPRPRPVPAPRAPVQRAPAAPRIEPDLEAHVWAKILSVILLVLLIGASNFNLEAPVGGELSAFPLSTCILIGLVFCLVVLL